MGRGVVSYQAAELYGTKVNSRNNTEKTIKFVG